MKWLAIILLIFSFSIITKAQDQEISADSVIITEQIDTLNIKGTAIIVPDTLADKRTPGQAALLSAIMPGAGQIYNGKFWKLPLIYSGALTMGFYINFNHDRYIAFRTLLLSETDSDPRTINDTPLNDSQLRRRTDNWRRNRDLLIGLTIFLYALNIIDAHVDAHLKDFDVSENLALQINPSVQQTLVLNQQVNTFGLSLTLKFLP